MTTGETAASPAAKTALIVGATASLAQPLCRLLALKGYQLILAGRDQVELKALANDLNTRYEVSCRTLVIDFLDSGFLATAFLEKAGDISHLIVLSGEMGNSDIASIADIAFTMHLNYTIPAQLAAAASARMAEHNGGTVALISSVAGDRGRAKIAAYGSAKAALSTFASGLRQAYAKRGVHVLTVKPGFTDTPMTWGMRSKLMASRESVARAIVRAMEKKKNVVYVPVIWRVIMLAIRLIPEWLFKRLSF